MLPASDREPLSLPSDASCHPEALMSQPPPFPGSAVPHPRLVGQPWFSCPRPSPAAPVRLICLPYAGGGGAVFRQWPARLSGTAEVWPVLLPGREARFRERAYTRMDPLVNDLARALLPLLDRPFALFGHSMGALIAFGLCRVLQRQGMSPVRLFVAGSRPPHASFEDDGVVHLPDAEFLDGLHRRYQAIPDAVRENQELAQIVLPALRADFELLATCRFEPGPVLPAPVVAYGGREDQTVSATELEAWARHTGAAFRCRYFAGGHFFLRSAESELLDDLSGELAAAGPGPGSG
jgi:medium-chain acyl-[acyl-carrier-protein] hydrolase